MSQDRLARYLELLEYNPASGALHWRVTRGGLAIAGSRAGCIHKWNGYRYIIIEGRTHREHRVIWFMMMGEWPDGKIDHINGDRADNRWANLREATDSQNKANSRVRPKNKSGFKGVSLNRGKWAAYITVGHKVKNLGRYSTKEEAHAAYCKAAMEAFGDFARFE